MFIVPNWMNSACYKSYCFASRFAEGFAFTAAASMNHLVLWQAHSNFIYDLFASALDIAADVQVHSVTRTPTDVFSKSRISIGRPSANRRAEPHSEHARFVPGHTSHRIGLRLPALPTSYGSMIFVLSFICHRISHRFSWIALPGRHIVADTESLGHLGLDACNGLNVCLT